MEKNMSGIQPRTLSNRELLVHATLELDGDHGMPMPYQIELLRRFNLLAPLDETPTEDPAQLDLFPDTK